MDLRMLGYVTRNIELFPWHSLKSFSSAVMWCLFSSFSGFFFSFLPLSRTAERWDPALCFIIFSHRSREAQCILFRVISWAITVLLHDCRSFPLASSFSVIMEEARWWWRKQPAIRRGCKGSKLRYGRRICKELLLPFAEISIILLVLGRDMRME